MRGQRHSCPKTHHFESERIYIPLYKRGNEGDFLESNLTNLP